MQIQFLIIVDQFHPLLILRLYWKVSIYRCQIIWSPKLKYNCWG